MKQLLNVLAHSWILGVWIVAIMESLASRGEFMMLRDIADENAYKGIRSVLFHI